MVSGLPTLLSELGLAGASIGSSEPPAEWPRGSSVRLAGLVPVEPRRWSGVEARGPTPVSCWPVGGPARALRSQNTSLVGEAGMRSYRSSLRIQGRWRVSPSSLGIEARRWGVAPVKVRSGSLLVGSSTRKGSIHAKASTPNDACLLEPRRRYLLRAWLRMARLYGHPLVAA